VVPRRTPRYSYSNGSSSWAARSWARARAMQAARVFVAAADPARSTKPAGIRTSRTIRRDASRRSPTLVHGWRR
jgi:hypothetical protein